MACKMVEITTCDSGTVLSLKTRLNEIYKVIDTYRWVIEAYVSDFYVKDHWSRLAPSWQEFLDQVDFRALSCLLTGQSWSSPTSACSVSPLSLLALKAFVEHNALNRGCVNLDDAQVTAAVSCTLGNKDSSRSSAETTQVDRSVLTTAQEGQTGDRKPGFKNGQLMEMQHIFRKHVKPKKQHEIRQLGKVIEMVTQASGSDHVVDVGAGLGHLSRLLTFAHGLKVTTVEAAGGHAPKATEFDRELKKDIQKKLKRQEASEEQQEQGTFVTPSDLPQHVVCRVDPNISTEDFLALVLHTDSGANSSAGDKDDDLSKNTRESAENLGRSNATPMDREHSIRMERICGQCELKEKELTSSSSVPEETGDQIFMNQEDTCLGSSTTSQICSEETAAKFCKYDANFQKCLNCDRDKVASVQNNSKASGLSDNHGSSLHSQQTVSALSELSDPAVENRSCHVKSLGSEQCLSQCTTFCSIQNQNTGEEQSQITMNLSECVRETSARQIQNCDNDTSETDQESFGQHDVEKRSLKEQESCLCLNAKTRSVETEERECTSGNKKEGDCAVGDGDGGEGRVRQERNRLLLAGLHACGDLTATLFRVFLNCPAVAALVSVGCCYMKLSAYSESDEAHCEKGYPLSQFVRSLPTHPLTYEAREMACHFADAYAKRLLDSPPHLKIHSYRAALQYVVTRVRPDFVPGATRLIVKKGAEMPFPQYASQCLQRLGVDASDVPDHVMAEAESMTRDWRRVVAFYTLRLSLAPLVETALLLDRMLFLYEHGIASVAVPVFDSALSPRNFALLACKAQTSL